MNKFKIIITILFIFLLNLSSYSYDLDLSVNNDIERQYNSNKLNEDMGIIESNKTNLSKKKQQKITNSPPKSSLNYEEGSVINALNQKTTSNNQNSIKIPSGTKFSVKSSTMVSGWSGINSLLSFTSTQPVYKNGITIPSGTVFKGIICASHPGQISGNGGLLEIKITSMILNGKTCTIEGKITKANSKNIYFNHIKGSRQYIKGVSNQINNGIKFYKSAKNFSSKLSSNPIGTIISPLPIITGMAGTTLYTVISPITGLKQRGKNITLPSGTIYEIKLTKDVWF